MSNYFFYWNKLLSVCLFVLFRIGNFDGTNHPRQSAKGEIEVLRSDLRLKIFFFLQYFSSDLKFKLFSYFIRKKVNNHIRVLWSSYIRFITKCINYSHFTIHLKLSLLLLHFFFVLMLFSFFFVFVFCFPCIIQDFPKNTMKGCFKIRYSKYWLC